MGGNTAPATCTEAANLSLLAAFSILDGRTAQVQQSQYYLIRIQYPNRTLLYIIRRSVGTACVVDTNDLCVATVSGLPDDFDVSDLPGDVPPRIPAGRDASEPPVTTDTEPDAVENPYPTNQATGVTVDAPLLSWAASPQATSYDLYWGTTKDLAADADLSTPINTSETAVPLRRPGATAAARRLADGTTYYWRVDAKNAVGVTRGNVWSFTTGAALPNVAGVYEGNTTIVVTTNEGDIEAVTRDRFNVWQVSSDVMHTLTILEVLSADNPVFAQALDDSVGQRPQPQICALLPNGTCRCDNRGCAQELGYELVADVETDITFMVSQMSYRSVFSGERLSTLSGQYVGTYEKVADDPGPLPEPQGPAPPSPPGEPGAGGPEPPAAPTPTPPPVTQEPGEPPQAPQPTP